MDISTAREIVLSIPGIEEYDHFGKGAYRLKAKPGAKKPGRTFMTLWIEEQRAVLMLTVEEQAGLHARHPEAFFPLANKWGGKGATFVSLEHVSEKLFREALRTAMVDPAMK